MKMIKRKVIWGNGTYLVSLPMQLCTLMGIEKGTVMRVEFNQKKKQFLFTAIEEK